MSLPPDVMAMMIQQARNQGGYPPAGQQGPPAAPQQTFSPQPPIFPQTPDQGGMPPQGQPAGAAPQNLDDVMKQQLIGAGQQGQQLTMEQIQRARAAGDQIAAARRHMQDIGPTHFQPHGPLAWLARIALATGPGRGVESARFSEPREQYGRLAAQVESLQKQQQLEQSALPSTTGMIYHPLQTLTRQETAEAAQMRAKAYQDYTKQIIPIRQGLMQIAQGKLDERTRHDRVSEWLQGQGIQVQRDRNGVILTIGMNGQQLKADEFNAAVANGHQGIIDQTLQALGVKAFQGVPSPTGETAVQPVTAGATQPFQNTQQTAPANKAAKIKKARGAGTGEPGSSPDNPIVIH